MAWTVRQARLDVPVLIFGCQEEETLTRETPRRDSFCGLLSIGEVLRQIGAKYSVGPRPICFPSDASFAADLDWFSRVCRVVGGVRNARYGQIGTRPDAFWTCRFDEKQLQRLGATTVVLDLSEAIAGANAIADSDPEVAKIAQAIGQYADASAMPPAQLLKSAKLELFLRRWCRENAIDALAIQCWTSIQNNYGVCSCLTMSRFGDEGLPSACEADILGAMSMHACHAGQRQPGRPGRLEQPPQRGRGAGQRLALRRVSRLVRQAPGEARHPRDHGRLRRGPARKRLRHGRAASPIRPR